MTCAEILLQLVIGDKYVYINLMLIFSILRFANISSNVGISIADSLDCDIACSLWSASGKEINSFMMI